MGDLSRRLEALRREYAAGLPAAVSEARAALERSSSEGAAIEELWQIVHRLYGTAGSYGLDAVARSARELETLVLPHRNADALPTEVADSARETLQVLTAQASEAART